MTAPNVSGGPVCALSWALSLEYKSQSLMAASGSELSPQSVSRGLRLQRRGLGVAEEEFRGWG